MTKGTVSGALVSACYKEREHGQPCLQLENCTELVAGENGNTEDELIFQHGEQEEG